MAVGGLRRSRSADPGEGMVGPGAAEGADMCPCAVGMSTDDGDAADVKVDADSFAIWGTEGAIDDFSPGGFAIKEFCSRVSIVVVFTDGMVLFTA